MARILVVGVVFIAAPCALAELKPTRQPISANAAAETNFMLSPLCVSLRRPGEPVGRASPARQPDSNDNRLFLRWKGQSTWLPWGLSGDQRRSHAASTSRQSSG